MTIRWGIIGCGNVTEVKSGPGFQKARGSELAAVMRRTPGLARDYAERHGVPAWYEDADALIQDPNVDIVSIATPPGTHLEYALKVCAAGKHAYVEKPMARTARECDQMVDAFRRAGLKLFVAYYRRGLPRFKRAQELLADGAIGEMTSVTYRYSGQGDRSLDRGNLPWRLRAEEAGGGLFFDLGSHTLDILDYLLGPLRDVHGDAANRSGRYDVEDVVVMNFTGGNGARGAASWDFGTGVRQDLIEFFGTKGSLSLSTFGDPPLRLETKAGVREIEVADPPHVQQPLIQSIVDELHGEGVCPSTGESGARTAHVMDAAVRRFYRTRDDEFWTRPRTWGTDTPA